MQMNNNGKQQTQRTSTTGQSSSSTTPNEQPQSTSYRLRKCSASAMSYSIVRFPDKVDFTKLTPPIQVRKKRLEDDQIDFADAGLDEKSVETGVKSAKQLEREKKREDYLKRARERKREYIMEDKEGKATYEGRSEVPQSGRYCFLALTSSPNPEFLYIPVNEEWVHFRQRVSTTKKPANAEVVEKLIKKSEESSSSKLKSLVSESSSLQKQFDEEPPRRRGAAPARRKKVKGEFDDDDEMEIENEDGEHFDFEGGMEDDEEYMDSTLENPIYDQLPPEELFSDSDSDEELSSSGKELKALLDNLREGRKKKKEDEVKEEEKPEIKEEPEDKLPEVKSEEEPATPAAEETKVKRGRGRPRKTDKTPPKTSTPPSTSSGTPPSTGVKRKSEGPESASKKQKTDDITDPSELKKEILNLFQQSKSILVKDFMALYLKNVKRSKQEKKERTKLLSQLLKDINVSMQNKEGVNYFVFK